MMEDTNHKGIGLKDDIIGTYASYRFGKHLKPRSIRSPSTVNCTKEDSEGVESRKRTRHDSEGLESEDDVLIVDQLLNIGKFSAGNSDRITTATASTSSAFTSLLPSSNPVRLRAMATANSSSSSINFPAKAVALALAANRNSETESIHFSNSEYCVCNTNDNDSSAGSDSIEGLDCRDTDLDKERDNDNDGNDAEYDGQDSETFAESAAIGSTANKIRSNYRNILAYEPKLYRIFLAYHEATAPNESIDCSGHVMVTCLKHIISFCSWARSNDAILQWISAEVNENIDLRPRVRNGLSLLFVYVICAAKSNALGNSTDMFSVMQDPQTGLGIPSRSSLKIYNDHLNYYSFLKSCLTGLILAGIIPENERSNQPKRIKKANDNYDEIVAFQRLKDYLIDILERGKVSTVKFKLGKILSLWYDGSKNKRIPRFSLAVKYIVQQQQYEQQHLQQYQPMGEAAGFEWGRVDSNSTCSDSPTQTLTRSPIAGSSAILSAPSSASSATTEDKFQLLPTASASATEVELKQLSDSSMRAGVMDVMWLMQFERVSSKIWSTNLTQVFDTNKFLESIDSTVYLIDYQALLNQDNNTDTTANNQLPRISLDFTKDCTCLSLSHALRQSNALVACWTPKDYPQLVGLCRRASQVSSFYDAWSAAQATPVSDHFHQQHLYHKLLREKGVYLLAMEQTNQFVFLIRTSDSFSMTPNTWRYLYPRDLNVGNHSIRFSEFLSSIFSHFAVILNRNLRAKYQSSTNCGGDHIRIASSNSSNAIINDPSDDSYLLSNIIVKYYSHPNKGKSAIDESYIPSILAKEAVDYPLYQTLGVLSDPAVDILKCFADNIPFGQLNSAHSDGYCGTNRVICHEILLEMV